VLAQPSISFIRLPISSGHVFEVAGDVPAVPEWVGEGRGPVTVEVVLRLRVADLVVGSAHAHPLRRAKNRDVERDSIGRAVARDISRLVFTAGACPLDESGAIVAVGDVAARAERVMTNLRIALQAAEADLTDVVNTTVYVASQRREDLLAVWEVVRRHFGDHDAPSTLLGVAVLGYGSSFRQPEPADGVRRVT
jgi:enamine deaminase RidA (YjgF/YER057c/UK114 family)